MNYFVGWGLILAAFVSGAVLGAFFYRDDFLGGYASFRRRTLRLGHIAMAALGAINVLYSLSPIASEPLVRARVASWGFAIGGVAMPTVCWLSAWRPTYRRLFFVPVAALIVAALQVLRMGLP